MANEPRLAVESIAGLRPYQEDSALAQNLADGRLLVAVADGMGGHAAGEVASALALETLVSALEDGKDLREAFVHANAQVHEKAREPGKQGMGTTLVAALVEDGEYIVANVGDSRGYLVTPDGIKQLTDDHSFVAEAVKRGQTLEEAMATPWRDALTRSIGTEAEVEVDTFGPFPVSSDSALLICSDGLYKTLEDDDLRRIFGQSSGPRGAAQTLVSAAFDSGSDDNISVVIAEYGEVPREAQGTMPLEYTPDPADDLGDVAADSAHAVAGEGVSGADVPDGDSADSDSTATGWAPTQSAPGEESAVLDGGETAVDTLPMAVPALKASEAAGPPVGAIVAAVLALGLVVVLLLLN